MARNSRKVPWFGCAIGAVLAILAGLVLDVRIPIRMPVFEAPLGQGLVNYSYDLLFVPRHFIKADEVRMIYMDEESYKNLNQSLLAMWDRELHAKLLEYLKAAHAKAVAFDIVFSDPGPDPQADDHLARALKDNGRVVLAVDVVTEGVQRSGIVEKTLTPPDSRFRVPGVTLGTGEVSPDGDLVIRKDVRTSPDDQIPCLGWATAEMAGAPITRTERHYQRERWINYYGPPLYLPAVSYYRLFSPDGFDASFFSNKVVFVGQHTTTKVGGERKDEYATPFSSWVSENRFIPGVEYQATACLNLLRGEVISRLPHEWVWFSVLGGVVGFGIVRFRPLSAIGVAVGLSIVAAALAYYLFVSHYILAGWLILAGVQIPVALFWSITFNSVQLYVQNRLYEQSLRMYLPPKLVKKFSANKELLKPGAEKHVLTLLFTDIADFTTLSEGMDPDELAALMNAYFQQAVGSCIHRTDGTVVKYIGDAIFAFWNAPEHQPDHAVRACEAALRFRELNTRAIQGRQMHTRMGLHTGVVNVGNFGSEERVDYTALGENVNLASRLEGLNKFLGTECLLSGQTKTELGEKLITRRLGSFRLKGFESLVEVHELVGWPDDAEKTRAWREAFTEALKTYEERNLEFAAMGFKRVLELKPNDGPAQFYLKQIAERAAEEVTDQWATYTVLKEK